MALVTNVVNGSSATRLLLLLHGYGADERDLEGLLPYLDADGTFATVLPRAPFAVPGTPGYASPSWTRSSTSSARRSVSSGGTRSSPGSRKVPASRSGSRCSPATASGRRGSSR